ncbi:SPARC-related modular calcium-binding protein 2 [Turdus rufiventris]|nr:SPARC-related modular calcium-binding protein 2 [Turdus rufiventris]
MWVPLLLLLPELLPAVPAQKLSALTMLLFTVASFFKWQNLGFGATVLRIQGGNMALTACQKDGGTKMRESLLNEADTSDGAGSFSTHCPSLAFKGEEEMGLDERCFHPFLRVDQDKDRECSLDCAGSPQKSLCASDGRTFLSRCEFQRAKCKDPQLEIAYRGNCKDVSRCVAERKYTQEQARKEFQQVFIPECNDDGTYSQVENFSFSVLHDWKVRVQCHSYTGYCWCVTPNGRPISGTAVAHKTPRCPGSVSEKLPQREGAGKTDDASAPALETQPQGDEEDIASRYPTLWTEQVKSRQNKTNKSSASSCDQELQSALEEAKQPQKDNVFIPECAQGGLYKPVQCHPSTGYCWCVLVDTGRPIPGTSTRYEQPKCDNGARAHPTKTKDLYKGRQLQVDCHAPPPGYMRPALDTMDKIPIHKASLTSALSNLEEKRLGCPGAKKNEFLTSVLDALSTDMVHAVSDPSLSSSRVSEPDPNHTLEERVVHWYFKQLDKNSSGDIGKKEIKPFKRFLRKKSKPKKCVKKFVEYCDVNNDKSLSVQELMGCLGVTKEEGWQIDVIWE